MKKVAALALILASSPMLTGASEPIDPLVGTWILEHFVDTPENGAPIHRFGERPVGLFIFTADGHVSVSLMRDPRAVDASTDDQGSDGCVPRWYCSYFGTYRHNPSQSTWTTRVIGGNVPDYIGTEQTRSFRIERDRMTISETHRTDGGTVRGERVFRRAE